ncbi:MAG: YhdP family protein, partial [Pseudomonadota bacterium]
MNRAASGGVRPVLWALLNRLVTVVWIGALTLLILAALYVGLGRQVMANLHHFEPEIETALTQALGRPVHLSDLSGDWQGLDPVLRVGEMTVGAQGQADASLGHLKVRLDSWASLVRLRLVFRELRASGGEATLAQQPDGGFAVAGIWQPSASGEEPGGAADAASDALGTLDGHLDEWIDQAGRLLSDPVVTLTDLRLRVEPASGEPVALRAPAMDVRFEDGLFSASGHLIEDDDNRRRIGAFALEGRHLLSSGFTGDLFLDLDSAGIFSDLFTPYEWRGLSVDAFNARAEAWLTFRQAQPQRARMTLQLPELGLTSPVAPVPRLRDLSADLLWQRTEAGWLLQARGSPFRWGGEDAGGFSGRVERNSDGLKVSAQGLDLGVISSMAHRSALLPAEEQQRLAAHDPSGLMERLAVTIPDDGPWRLRGTFRDMAVAAVDGAPSGSGLDGYLETGPREGHVTLESGPARIGFPELFDTDWRFQRLAGRIRWARRSDGWEMVARRLVGRHEGMDASGGFRLRLHEGSSDTLSLRVGIAGGRTGMLSRFVPRERVPPELYSFLTEAIGSGTVTSGWYYGHGDIGGDDADETAANRAFTSSMAYRFRDTELTYDPEWPALEGAAGQVRVQGDEGHVRLDEGSVAGVELEPSQIRVTGDEKEGLRVDVDTGARREGELLTEQWRSSPLERITGDWLGDLRVSGSSHVDLALSLWPGQERSPAMDVRLGLADGHVHFAPAALEWREVNGPVRFSTDEGFANTDLKARFMGEPVTLQLRDGPEQAPVFRQQGRLAVARLAQWLERPLPRVNGQLSYNAAFRPTEGPTLRLDADLADLVLDWPAPFSKAAGDDHRLTTQVDFGGADSEAVRIQGDWQPLGAFRLVMRDGAVERGRIGLGVRRTELPDEPVLSLTGKLPGADLQQWWQAMEDIPAGAVAASDEDGASQEPVLPPLRVELGIGEPRFRDWTLSPVRLLAEADLRGQWQVRLDSDWIGGTLGNGDERALAV